MTRCSGLDKVRSVFTGMITVGLLFSGAAWSQAKGIDSSAPLQHKAEMQSARLRAQPAARSRVWSYLSLRFLNGSII